MKKLISILVVLSLMLSCSGYAFAAGEIISENNFSNDAELSTYLTKQDTSNEIYNKLLHYFTENGKYDLEEHYPDFYAGAYIGESGELVILTKNASEDDIATLERVCGKSGYTIETAEYSINELITTKNQISSRIQKAKSEKLYLGQPVSISIRDNHNKVYVGLCDLNKSKGFVDYLTKGISSSIIQIYEAEELEEYRSYYPGDYIDSYMGGSAGYKVKLRINGVDKIGFITAAHVTNGSNVFVGALHLNKIGNTIVEQNSGSVDAAFVEMTGNHSFYNQVDGYTITPNLSVIPAIGSTVYKIGSQSNTTSGTVLSNLNETEWPINGQYVTFTNLCETTVSCINGDSGGLMYTKNGTEYRVIGNIKGGGGGVFYATKHSYLPWDVTVIQ